MLAWGPRGLVVPAEADAGCDEVPVTGALGPRLPLMSLVFDVVPGSLPDAVTVPALPAVDVASVAGVAAAPDEAEGLAAVAKAAATLAAAGDGVA